MATATGRRRAEWVGLAGLARILEVDDTRAERIAEATGIRARQFPTCARQWSRSDADRVAREFVEQPATSAG